MDEFNEYFSEEFFIIDSNNLDSVKEKLYGYMVDFDNNKVLTNKDVLKLSKISYNGAYVYVKKQNNNINIYQDYEGSYGIYVYKNNDYFCISNSFLKLVEYLKKSYPLSLNEDVAKTFFATTYTSFIMKQTLINEIEILPRNSIVSINLKNKELKIDNIDYSEKTISVSSYDGIKILDRWHEKWTSLFRELKRQTNNIWVDLSGGFDSRGIFSLVLSSNINLNEIFVHSIDGEGYTLKEDYQIASLIAEKFNFKLNNPKNLNTNRIHFQNIETPLKISFYLKLGFHNSLHYKLSRNVDTIYSIGGFGGELVRNYTHYLDEEEILRRATNVSPSLIESTKKIIELNKENLDIDDFAYGTFSESMSRYHFGMGSVENYFANTINLNPYLDSDLCKLKRNDEICDDPDLLLALIFVRYCPELLNFKFQSGEFKEDTINYAKKINEKYPFKRTNLAIVSSDSINKSTVISNSKPVLSIPKIYDYLKKIFFTNSFRKTFELYYPQELYYKFTDSVKNNIYNPLQDAYPLFAILKIIDDIKGCNDDLTEWFNNFLELDSCNDGINYDILKMLLTYNTGRIDIINFGKNNSIKILEISDKESKIYDSTWIEKSKGSGKIIENSKNSLKVKFKCINDGDLRISLRGKHLLDKNGSIFPVYIDYIHFTVNNNNILNGSYIAWHDKPYVYSRKVKNNEIIEINIKWCPFNSNSIINDNFMGIKSNNEQIEKKNSVSSSENEEIKLLKRDLNNFKKEIRENIDSCNYLFKTLFLDFELNEPKNVLDYIQKLSTELLIFVKNVCKKYGINWWLDYGTLLGAIRHEYYVPWDDDVDIGMMRADYIKFNDIIQNEIKKYSLDDIIKIEYHIRKIDNKEVNSFIQLFVRHQTRDTNVNILGGVDVFPYDFINDFDENDINEVYYNSKINLFRNLSENFNRDYCLNKYYEDLNCNINKTDYIIPGVEGACGPKNLYKLMILETDKVFPLKEVKFGNVMFPSPNNHYYYLKSIYNDYMSLPKSLRRHNRVDWYRYNRNNEEVFGYCLNRLKKINEKFENNN